MFSAYWATFGHSQTCFASPYLRALGAVWTKFEFSLPTDRD